jgi:hypothetical protein
MNYLGRSFQLNLINRFAGVMQLHMFCQLD